MKNLVKFNILLLKILLFITTFLICTLNEKNILLFYHNINYLYFPIVLNIVLLILLIVIKKQLNVPLVNNDSQVVNIQEIIPVEKKDQYEIEIIWAKQ